ncbi:hypothetical protein CLV30_11659 [Haloactinopolyspora alba]|uniref:Uncharacterized protein n=1 Tax=Haloactinopolyspora alba TaxID=648780 RepID=A0A2P8DT57_9ACTN|nr:hypothetical protein [Haloactinopolyspora alba]PSL00399.1 hypothetical protein CLV30_11659 [Haloactinopolyspora alba]
MASVIGVVGPHDVVDEVAPYCGEHADISALCLDYTDETETTAIVESQADNVTGWLFTGIGPYTRAERAGVLDRPAVYVPYTREALQLALVGLLRTNQRIDRLSVDTMSHNAVRRCLEHAGLDPTHVRVLPFRPDLSADDYAEFHRRAHRDGTGTHAITCLSSVHARLDGELPTIRLRPTRHAVRSTLDHLTLSIDEAALGDAQIVVGLVETADGTANVVRHVSELSGCVGQRADGTVLIASTRGRLAEASAEFTDLPLLGRLSAVSDRVHVGFGLGHTAAEAEHLARRALVRSRRAGPVAAVLSRRNDPDVVLAHRTSVAPAQEPTMDERAQQAGIAPATLTAIRALRLDSTTPLTAADLGHRLGRQTRSARRILAKLERAGLAQRAGEDSGGVPGRPATLYRIHVR